MVDVRKPTVDNFSLSGRYCDGLNQRRNHQHLNQIKSIAQIIKQSKIAFDKENSFSGIRGKQVSEILAVYKALKTDISDIDETFTKLPQKAALSSPEKQLRRSRITNERRHIAPQQVQSLSLQAKSPSNNAMQNNTLNNYLGYGASVSTTAKTMKRKQAKKSVFVLHSDSENSRRSDEEGQDNNRESSFVDEEFVSARKAFLGNGQSSLVMQKLPLPDWNYAQQPTELSTAAVNMMASEQLMTSQSTSAITAKDLQQVKNARKERGAGLQRDEGGVNRSLVAGVMKKPPLLKQKQNTLFIQRASVANLSKTRAGWRHNDSIRVDESSNERNRSGSTSSNNSKPSRTLSLFYPKNTPRNSILINHNNNSSRSRDKDEVITQGQSPSGFHKNSSYSPAIVTNVGLSQYSRSRTVGVTSGGDGIEQGVQQQLNSPSKLRRVNAELSELLQKNQGRINLLSSAGNVAENQQRMNTTTVSGHSFTAKNKSNSSFGYDLDHLSAGSIRIHKQSPNPFVTNHSQMLSFPKIKSTQSPNATSYLEDSMKSSRRVSQNFMESSHTKGLTSAQWSSEQMNHPLIDFILKH